jgi:hypothetical protein
VCKDAGVPVPFRLLTRRAGPLGLALTLFDLWRRLPPKQRRQVVAATRKHGPRLASQAVKRTRARSARRRAP